MAGNVWEWCSTKWRNDYEKYEDAVDDDPAGTDRQMVRGGSFSYGQLYVRCAYRLRLDPGDRDGYLGFRVVGPWASVTLDSDASDL
ncbi:MAG: SUMF1/EgtB/PvdO family nonheme iron enzyme [Caldilineaceae bacterium]